MTDDVEAVQRYLDSQQAHNHENLADQLLGTEDDGEEYTQELITAIEIKDKGWIDIKMGTFDIAFGDVEGEVEWEAELVTGGFWGGTLSDITGFKSLG
jgi:hypothetical protein